MAVAGVVLAQRIALDPIAIGDATDSAKQDALERMANEIEHAYLFGTPLPKYGSH